MSDLRTLKTVHQDVSTRGNVTLQFLSVKGGVPILDALQDSSCFLDVVITVLGDIAVESNEGSDGLYAVITNASIAKALVDSVASAIYRADRGQSAEVNNG